MFTWQENKLWQRYAELTERSQKHTESQGENLTVFEWCQTAPLHSNVCMYACDMSVTCVPVSVCVRA